ncbi:MAG: hypothetical protein QOD90_4526, partial [Mycobacterium sp.]|nr:hypothetical protein [Mycobacterium sp.]
MFDELVASTTGTHGAGAVDAWSRVESAACARRLAAMVTMLDDAYAAADSTDRDQWCLDNWGAVCAHIGAAQRITSGTASNLLIVATALRDRFPKVAAVFAAGLISYPLARAIVTRGALVTDPAALRALDEALAQALQTWEPMSVDKTEQAIDAFIAQVDPHALRRTQTRARGRCVDVVIEDGSGLAAVFASLFAPDAKAFDARLNALADTVCPADPRTKDQRRADAMGALAHGADRLVCLCDTEDCPAADTPASTGVVVYVIAHHDTITDPELDEPPGPSGSAGPGDTAADADADAADRCAENADDEAKSTNSEPAAPSDECAGLDGVAPPMFTKPLRDMTLAEAKTPTTGQPSQIRPGAIIGGGFVPGPVTRRAARHAKIRPIVHPGQAPPEPRHTPSKRLAEFVRCRDLTCRFPGCHHPATTCDLDHTIPWPYGATGASNLKCLCRFHHLLKTFWGGDGGWRDRQLPDGTIVWTAPDGRTHTTTPASRLRFPTLSEPTAPIVATRTPPPAHTAGLTMPRR